MCLAIPMKIAQISADGLGVADLGGVRHEVDLSLVGPVQVGDYVIIHAGYAIGKLDEGEAVARIALFRELAETMTPTTS
jgi:hydrogenase expression/formation protein HypC